MGKHYSRLNLAIDRNILYSEQLIEALDELSDNDEAREQVKALISQLETDR